MLYEKQYNKRIIPSDPPRCPGESTRTCSSNTTHTNSNSNQIHSGFGKFRISHSLPSLHHNFGRIGLNKRRPEAMSICTTTHSVCYYICKISLYETTTMAVCVPALTCVRSPFGHHNMDAYVFQFTARSSSNVDTSGYR